ncbi:MAG: phosphotyrosine protein phosphatase [Flavobacteriales bacterium]|nr:phosphotyrosine protein phosphatase [Flavobacteriales bacterium]
MNILFVCSANKDRSRTAEDYFAIKYPELEFDSAGTNQKICNQLGTNYIAQEQLEMANCVYVMEEKHLQAINDLFGSVYNHKITVLNIADVYEYGTKALVDVLKEKITIK